GHSGLLEAGAACMVLGAAWLVMRTGGIHRAFAVALMSGLLVSHHAFFGDAFVLVPAALFLLQAETSFHLKSIALLLLCPLAYLPLMSEASAVLNPATGVLVLLAVLLLKREAPAGGTKL